MKAQEIVREIMRRDKDILRKDKNLNDTFKITVTRTNVIPNHTDTKTYGEMCQIKVEGSTRIINLFIQYNNGFDKWLRRKLK